MSPGGFAGGMPPPVSCEAGVAFMGILSVEDHRRAAEAGVDGILGVQPPRLCSWTVRFSAVPRNGRIKDPMGARWIR